jgi:hypothetical protein
MQIKKKINFKEIRGAISLVLFCSRFLKSGICYRSLSPTQAVETQESWQTDRILSTASQQAAQLIAFIQDK